MKNLIIVIKNLAFKAVTLGVDPDESSASNRITIFTNVMAIMSLTIGGSIYSQLADFGAPQESIYAYNFAILVAASLLLSNYLGYRQLARVLGLMVMMFVSWTAAIIFGKSFNGVYFFIATTIFATGAFSKSKLWVRVFLISLPVASMFVVDTLSHGGTLPITGLHSSNFPVQLLYFDTFFTMALIIIMVWVEKTLADKHEEGLESALATIRDEKQKLSVIFENVELGILITDSQLKIDQQYSEYLSEIFQTDKIGNENLLDFILEKTTLDNDTRATIQTVLSNCIGEDDLNWMINKDHLPTSIAINVKGEKKFLNLNWSPVVINDSVTRVVLSLRDVTHEVVAQEKERLQKAIEQKIQVILRSLIKVGLRQTREFVTDVQRYVSEIHIESMLNSSDKHLSVLHTFKGEARLIGFTDLANTIHEVELGLKNKNLQADVMTDFINEVNLVYSADQKLFTGSEGEAKQAWSLLSYVQSLVHRMNEQVLKLDFDLQIGGIDVQDRVVYWPETMIKQIENILLHSFQNSLDHGYILPKQGRLVYMQVDASVGPNGYRLIVRDGGVGLDEDALKQEWEKLSQEERQIYKSPLAILFRSGYSSTENVSITSGQGVGLAAVHEAVSDLSGMVSLKNRKETHGTELEVFIPHENSLEAKKAS